MTDRRHRVATALARAYVAESGLLEDDPRRYIERLLPHADAVLAELNDDPEPERNSDMNILRHYEMAGDFWRAPESGGPVEFWSGTEWRRSALPSRFAFLDDALGGGGSVREVLNPGELPDGVTAR